MTGVLLLVLGLFVGSLLSIVPASAAPTVANAQKEVNRLRTSAAAKYEAANEAKIKVERLQRETKTLKKNELSVRAKRDKAQIFLAKIAIAQHKGPGFGESFSLLFSRDPAQYLSDAGTLEIVGRQYSTQLRAFASAQQRLVTSQLIIRDRTAQLQIEQKRLNSEVASAKAALKKAENILASLKKEDREKLAKQESARENKILFASKQYAKNYKGDSSRGSQALKFALKQVGDIYVWAAAGPTRWDCSGLTMRAFQKTGISLPHSSRVQIRYGKPVSYKALKPGDLVFFGRPISHVAIYTGGGKMVHAPRPGKKVEVARFTLRFGKKPFVGARRL